MSPELRVEVTFLMTFSSVNPVKIGDGHNMEELTLYRLIMSKCQNKSCVEQNGHVIRAHDAAS